MSGEKQWRIRWGDLLLSENDITIGQAERIEALTGQTWLAMNPLRSAKHAAAIATVMVADATGRPEADVAVEVKSLKASDFLEGYLEWGDDDLPDTHIDGNPPVAGTSTSTSRTSRGTRGTGRQRSSEPRSTGTSG